MRFLADMGYRCGSLNRCARPAMRRSTSVMKGCKDCRTAKSSRRRSREERIVLTFDLDFAEIVAASGGRSVSVALFGCATRGLSS